jgi:hypothetical protein
LPGWLRSRFDSRRRETGVQNRRRPGGGAGFVQLCRFPRRNHAEIMRDSARRVSPSISVFAHLPTSTSRVAVTTGRETSWALDPVQFKCANRPRHTGASMTSKTQLQTRMSNAGSKSECSRPWTCGHDVQPAGGRLVAAARPDDQSLVCLLPTWGAMFLSGMGTE